MSAFEIGVCSWCIDRHDALRAIAVAGELGLGAIQLGFFTKKAVEEAHASAILDALQRFEHKVIAKSPSPQPVVLPLSSPSVQEGEGDVSRALSVAGTFIAFEGEDYSSIERIAATGGFGFDDAYADRLAIVRKVASLTKAIGVSSVAVHAGTVPVDDSSLFYRNLIERVREVADVLAGSGLRLLLETGREPAERLLKFIKEVGRLNVAINFDPANFVVYGSDDPVRAVTQLKGMIELVHLKDAKRSAKPGVEYGKPAPFGSGEAEVARVISKLRATGYRGPLLLESDTREGGLDTLRGAADYLRSMFA